MRTVVTTERRRTTRPGQGKVRREQTDRRVGSRGRVVRWTDTGFEMQCLGCSSFLPLDVEFWRVPAIARCLVCWREAERTRQAAARRDPAVYAEHLERYRVERRARRAA